MTILYIKDNQQYKVEYNSSVNIREWCSFDRTTFLCVSKLNLKNAFSLTRVDDYGFFDQVHEDHVNMFAHKNESAVLYNLKNGCDGVRYISLWKVKDINVTECFMRVFQGKGRSLRFRNKNTGTIDSLINLDYDSSWIHLSPNILLDYTIEFPKRSKVLNSTQVFFNVNATIGPDIKNGIFGILKDACDTDCPICMEEFGNESVFYPHDHMHPMCTTCAFALFNASSTGERSLVCPICRAEILI